MTVFVQAMTFTGLLDLKKIKLAEMFEVFAFMVYLINSIEIQSNFSTANCTLYYYSHLLIVVL